MGIDPFWTRRVLIDDAHNVILTIHLPFFLSACILLLFYWYELGRAKVVQISRFLRVYRIPAFIAIALSFIFEILTDALRVVPVPDAVLVSGVFYMVLFLTLSVLYMFSGVVLVRRMKLSAGLRNLKKHYKRHIHRVAAMVMVAGALLIFLVIFAVLVATPIYMDITYFFPLNVVFYSLTTAITLIHSVSFKAKRLKSHSSSSKDTWSKDTSPRSIDYSLRRG